MNKGDVFCPYCGAKQNNGQRCYTTRPKERVVYVILGIFLGVFGVHNFFAGYTKSAVAQLLITILLGWVIGIGFLITFIWSIVDVVTIAQDADGVPFS